ncbi:MAG: ETC complex I subunit [Nitratireductor sp.]
MSDLSSQRARIFSPAKTAMQSGKNKTGSWVLEFEKSAPATIEPLMGYTSSSDTKSQIRMKFDSKEAAVAYATRNGIAFTLLEPKAQKRRAMTYSENFNYSRNIPWTH